MIGAQLGAFGGRALARINTMPKPFLRGDEIPAETIMSWPIANRRALQKAGRVEFFPAPNGVPEPPKARHATVVAGPEYAADFGFAPLAAPVVTPEKATTGSGRYSSKKKES